MGFTWHVISNETGGIQVALAFFDLPFILGFSGLCLPNGLNALVAAGLHKSNDIRQRQLHNSKIVFASLPFKKL